MEILGSEFIVEMRAGTARERGQTVCTLEYIEGSDIDDEEALLYTGEPGQLPCGVCVEGCGAGGLALVQFSDRGITERDSVLLHALKRRQEERHKIGEKAK